MSWDAKVFRGRGHKVHNRGCIHRPTGIDLENGIYFHLHECHLQGLILRWQWPHEPHEIMEIRSFSLVGLLGATTAPHPASDEGNLVHDDSRESKSSRRSKCFMCFKPSNERDVEGTRTVIREKPTRVFRPNFPQRNHGTQESNFQGSPSQLGNRLAGMGFILTPSSLVPWFTLAPGSTSDPWDFQPWKVTADTPSRVTRQITRTSNYFDYAVSLLESPFQMMNSLEMMLRRRLLLWLGSWSLS